MYFTSSGFILFLAALIPLYYLTPARFRYLTLLAASLFFYTFSGFLPYLLATAVSTYLFGRALERHKSRLLVAGWLVLHLGLLAAVKIPAFGLLMPLAISFYTFQSGGYIFDVYRRKFAAQHNVPKFMLFVCFFPQLIQGPISRYDNLSTQLYEPKRFEMDALFHGLSRCLWGFFKKLVIADRLLVAVKVMSGDIGAYSGWYVPLNLLIYAVTLYADFTGGIDIAIGASRSLGIRLTENFNGPFFSRNIAEYWRRWHMTMGSWFRDYLFYPLSVSKVMRRFSKVSRRYLGQGFGKRLPVYVATIVTWCATGIWHGTGWNFVFWGLSNGMVIILSQELSPLYARFHARFAVGSTGFYHAFTVVRTFCLMSALRGFDIYPKGIHLLTPPSLPLSSLGLDAQDCLIVLASLAVLIASSVPLVRSWYEKRSLYAKLSLGMALLLFILIFGVYGFGYDSKQFIYNQF